MKRSKTLNRKRLFAELFAIYDFPLTIVEAPMGFGKTTAVKSFFVSEELNPQWISFRNSENCTTVFWDAFTSEIGKTDEAVGSTLKDIGFPADSSGLDKVFLLLNTVQFKNKVVVVMDDYHLTQNLRLNRFILQLANEEIINLHMIIITRDTTDFDFVELLSKGLCNIISRQQLKFTEVEVEDYCRMLTGEIAPPDLAKICEYTGGWISFIYLILLGIEQGIPIGMSRTIDELIEKAMYNSYSSEIQDFLIQLSIMDEFTSDQAEYVTGKENTADTLKQLNRKNAFVFYDEVSEKYSIHHILLDFLRMKQRFSDTELKELYGRLGNWYLGKGDFPNAYACLYRAGQTKRILFHLNEPKNIRDRVPYFKGEDEMFARIAQEELFQYPFAYLQHIFVSLISEKEDPSLSWVERLDSLQQYYESTDGINEEYRNRVMAEILAVRIFTMFNHVKEMVTTFKKIVRLLNGQQSYIAFQNNVYTFGSPHYLYLYFRDEGSFKKIKNLLSESVEYAKFSNGCGEGSDSLSLAEYALETGCWDDIILNSTKAILKAVSKRQISVILCAKFCLIRLRIFQGKVSEALELLEQLEQDIENTSYPAYHTTVAICKGYIYSCLSQPEKIPFWLQTGDMATATLYYQGFGFHYLVYGKALMAAGKYTELEVQTEFFQKQFALYSNQLGFIHNFIFKAVAKYHLYGSIVGTAILEEGLFTAQKDNIVMPFIEAAMYILKMVEIIAEKYTDNDYIQRICSGCRQYKQNVESICYEVAVLSPREIDVLSLAAQSLTRKEIAARLFISEGTVKTHFKNIYGKLEASGKVEAIKIAEIRGYIPSVSK